MGQENENFRDRVIFPSVVKYIDYPKEKRIEMIQTGIWVHYPLAEELFRFLNELDNQPKRPRMMGRCLISKTGNGKTSLISQFICSQIQRMNLPSTQYKYLLISTPPNPSLKTLYLRTLFSCNFNICKGSTEELWHILLTGLNKLQTRMLFYDDIDHLLNSQNDRILNQCRDVLKDISNCLMIPIILIGTEKAESLIRGDRQILSRYPIIRLDEWKNDKNFRMLLMSFEKGLPLQRPSNLDEKTMADLIYSYSDGTIGSISEVVMGSAIEAIKTGAEQITRDLVESLHTHRFSRF
jgi:hypothetical protein